LLAMGIYQQTNMLTDAPPSRASSLPQWIVDVLAILHSGPVDVLAIYCTGSLVGLAMIAFNSLVMGNSRFRPLGGIGCWNQRS